MLGQWGGGAKLRVIERGKLLVHEEFPDALSELAVPFLTECSKHRPAGAGSPLARRAEPPRTACMVDIGTQSNIPRGA